MAEKDVIIRIQAETHQAITKISELNRSMFGLKRGAEAITLEKPIRAIDKTGKVADVSRISFDKASGAMERATGKIEDLGTVTYGAHRRYQPFSQIVGKVGIWFAATTAIYGTMKAIKNIASMCEEYAVAMARVATVTRGSTEDVGRLSRVILDYVSTSKIGLAEAAKAMYLLGSAGLTVEEQSVGLKHVLDLTVGTFGNIEETGRLVAGSYNVFGKSMKNVSTISGKFKRICDILAYTYSLQQVELSEVASAFSIVGSAASILKVDFETLVGTIGTLNTGMLKGCYKNDTELLTDKGFKFFKDLDKTEKVATLNPETFEIEYQTPIEYINEPYKGLMYEIEGRHISLSVTPNHKLFIRDGQKRCKTRKYKLRRADESFGKSQTYIRGGKWKGKEPEYFILPSVELNYGGFNHQSGEIKVKIEDWIKFLAWYLSEGCSSFFQDKRKATNHKVKIYQSPGEKRDNIRQLLKRLPFTFYEEKTKKRKALAFVINSKQLFAYLQQFGKSNEKFIPQFIKELTSELLKIFISTYNDGDGRKRGNAFEITTNSTKMRDDLEEIGLKAGYGVSHYLYKGNSSFKSNYPIWKIYISNKIEFNFDQKKNLKDKRYNHTTKEEWVYYDGTQHCVEVEKYHTLFIRRNGKSLWCGNSRAGTSLMSAMVEIAKKSEMLSELFPITFDPTKPLDFVDIMDQLSVILGKGVLSAEDFRKLMDVFGLRGARAVASIIDRFKEWKEAIDVTDATFEDFAEDMKNTVEVTLGGAIKKLANTIRTELIAALEMKPGPSVFTRGLNEGLELSKNIRILERQLEVLGRVRVDQPIRGLAKWMDKIFTTLGVTTRLTDAIVLDTEEAAGWGKALSEYGFDFTKYTKEGKEQTKDENEALKALEEVAKRVNERFGDTYASGQQIRGILNEIAAEVFPLLSENSKKFLQTLISAPEFIEDVLAHQMQYVDSLEETKKTQVKLSDKLGDSLRDISLATKYVRLQTEGYSKSRVTQEKIADQEAEIVKDLKERLDIETERRETAVSAGKDTAKLDEAILAIHTVMRGILSGNFVLNERNLLVVQQTGVENKKILDLVKLRQEAETEAMEAAQSTAEWYATTTDEARAQFDAIQRVVVAAEKAGRIPYLTEQQKRFIEEHPAVMKAVEEISTIPVSIIVSEDPVMSFERMERKAADLKEVGKEVIEYKMQPYVMPPSLKGGVAYAPTGIIPEEIRLKSEVSFTLGPKGILTEEDRRRFNERMRQTIEEELRKYGEFHVDSTTATRR